MKNIISFPDLSLIYSVDRVAFKIYNVNIYWYGVLIFIGTSLGVLYAFFEFKKKKIDTDHLTNLLMYGIPISLIFARIYYVTFNLKCYKNSNIFEILNIRNGGIAIYGAILGSLITGIIYTKVKKIRIFPILDIFSISLLIGQCIGRFGNFFNCEAFGTKTKSIFRMNIRGNVNVDSVHPTFLYESFWNFLGILILMRMKKKINNDGELFYFYLIWYGFGRFFIEKLRADSLYIRNFRISVIVSFISFILGLLLLFKSSLKTKNNKSKKQKNKNK